jgi:prepilin-type processing-associated H-X9-DG protein
VVIPAFGVILPARACRALARRDRAVGQDLSSQKSRLKVRRTLQGKFWKSFLEWPKTYFWGVGEPGRAPKTQTGSWAYAILPFLEEQNVYQTRTWTTPVAFLICPSRRVPQAEPVVSEDDYGRYGGGGWTWGKTDYAANLAAIPVRPRCLSLDDFTDGASQTILAGEKAFDRTVETPTSWYWDEPFFLGGSKGTARDGAQILHDHPGILYKGNRGSAHSGGAQFLFADGSVHPLSCATSWPIVFALLTPDGGDVAAGY